MKFSENWLREWTNPPISTAELTHQLTMAGLEVDGITHVANAFSGIVIGEVLSVEKHPDADKLKVCKITVGDETLQIVCGASNVSVGIKVPTALIGAEIAPDFKIKRTKLRGVESFGMLCSAKELGLEDESQGLFILPEEAPIGESIRDYLQLDDYTIDVDLTPNRGDCLSIAGLAREVAVLNRSEYTAHTFDDITPEIDDTINIQLKANDACPQYIGLIIKDIDITADAPLWLTEKLRRTGIRSIDPIVDVTNYVMLELGQPMHAFDLDKLTGDITVRFAKENETLTLLNEQEITLTEKDLVIADDKKAIALAGIMGGLETAVTSSTKNILLESAHFAPQNIAGRARYHGLNTDSSHRFERGVDLGLQRKAMQRAAALIQQIGGGKTSNTIAVKNITIEPRTIELRYHRIQRILGITLDKSAVEEILTRLGMSLKTIDKGWQVTIPTNRFDITIEEDLIEELVRIYGYDKVEPTTPSFELTTKQQSQSTIPLRRFKQVLVDRDYSEIITYSFVDPKIQALISPDIEVCELLNPISEDLSVMRTSLWTGLIQTYLYNKNRQQNRLRFFESGLKFYKEGDKIQQIPTLAGLISGDIVDAQWGEKNRTVDFFDVKADVQALLALSTLDTPLTYQPFANGALHPGQAAKVMRNEQELGTLGALHPSIAQKLSINEVIYLFELNLQAIDITDIPKFATLSKYPLIRRDIALIVKEAINAGDIMQCVREEMGELLVDLQLFDVYQGQGVDEGYKSLALGIYIQHQDRTLKDEEINHLMQHLITTLTHTFNAKLRD